MYGLVSNGIKALVQACLSGLSQTVGQAYAKKDWKELNQKLDLYEYVVFVLVFFIFGKLSYSEAHQSNDHESKWSP